MPVHRLTGLLPWLLFNIILLFAGVSGSERTMYSSAGELVSLPWNHHGSFNCSSITWFWNSVGSQETIELVAHGAVKAKDQQLARRLRVGTNCSLHINNLTTADAGRYYSRLYHNENDYEDASVINLSLLNISVFASSPVTELKIGSTVTLVCKLLSPEPCGKSIKVSWVSETGAPLQGDRYMLSESECSSGLTVTLEHSDRNMKWRCQLTEEGKQKASHSYTTSFPGVTESLPTVYSSAGELVSHSYTTIFPVVTGSEPTVYSSAGELVSHSYTTIFPDVNACLSVCLPARLVFFFLLLAIPPIIGTIFYIRRRKHAQTDQMPSGPSLDYVNVEMLDRNAVPNFSVTQQNTCNDL